MTNVETPLGVLVIAHEPPTPWTGHSIPFYYHARELARAGDRVEVLHLAREDYSADTARLADECAIHEPVRLPPARSVSAKAAPVLNTLHPVNLTSRRPAMLSSMNAPELRRRVRALARERRFDVVLVDVTLAHLGAEFDDAVRVLMAMDPWSNAFASFRDRSRGFERASWALKAWGMRRVEARLYGDYDIVVVCTDDDARDLRARDASLPTLAVPNGVDTDRFRPAAAPSTKPAVVFVGDMSYPPNVHAVHEFHERVWPRVRERVPGARFVVVGRNPIESVRALAVDDASVDVTGAVDDVLPHLHGATLMVTPMVTGGGIKNKVLEGLACGIPVVATPLGARGIDDGTPGLVVRELGETMTDAVADLLSRPDRARELGEKARAAAESELGWAPRSRAFRSRLVELAAARGRRGSS